MSDATPENTSTSSIYKTLTWILVAALIGLYVLYNWYDGRLKQGLAGKDAELAQVAQRLSSAETSLRSAADAETGLRSEIARLQTEAQTAAALAAADLGAVRQELEALQARQEANAQELTARQSEVDRLTEELAQAASLEQDLRAQMASLDETHAAQKAELEAAQQRVAALMEEIHGLNQALAETEAKHAAEAQGLRSELEERIAFYRTALEGSEPDRAAQIAGLEAQAQTEHAALERAEQALKSREAELEGRLEEAVLEAQAQTQALQSAQQSHATEMSEARGRIFALDEELRSARGTLAALQEKLDLQVADLNAKLEQSQTALGAANAELEAAMRSAGEERQAQEGLIQEAQARISSLEASLVTERAQADQALAEQRRQAEAERREGQEVLAATRGLYSRFAELAARRTDRGMLLKLAEEDLRFRSGLAVLPQGELPSLDRIAALLKEHPALSALIEGHTDNAGPEEINLELSRARADAVRQALIDRGVPAERLTAEGAGEGRPIAENTTAAGRGQNRRVEVYVQEAVE